VSTPFTIGRQKNHSSLTRCRYSSLVFVRSAALKSDSRFYDRLQLRDVCKVIKRLFRRHNDMFQHFFVQLLLDRLSVLVFAPIPHPEPFAREHFLKRVLRAVDGYFFLHLSAHFPPPQISSSGTTNVHSRVPISSPNSLLAGC